MWLIVVRWNVTSLNCVCVCVGGVIELGLSLCACMRACVGSSDDLATLISWCPPRTSQRCSCHLWDPNCRPQYVIYVGLKVEIVVDSGNRPKFRSISIQINQTKTKNGRPRKQ